MKQADKNSPLPGSERDVTLSRRGLLQNAGCALAAAAAFPSTLAFAAGKDAVSRASGFPSPASTVGSVMTQLSNYMSAARDRALPDAVVEQTKHHVLDTFAAMVSGSELPPGRVAIQFARSYGGERSRHSGWRRTSSAARSKRRSRTACSRIPTRRTTRTPPRESHPGSADGSRGFAGHGRAIRHRRRLAFLRAVALGYDIGPRVDNGAGRRGVIENETHRSTHSIAGTFGSAAAAGCAADLNPQQMRWVLDYASQQASGIAAWQRDPDHIEKGFVFAGAPARNGVTARLAGSLRLDRRGRRVLRHRQFLSGVRPAADPRGMVDKLGERYEITRTNIKKWTRRLAHSGAAGRPAKTCRRSIRSPPTRCKKSLCASPPTKPLSWTIASPGHLHAVHGRRHAAGQDRLLPRRARQGAHAGSRPILRERAKVQLVPDAELAKAHARTAQAIVEVTLTDGTQLTEHVYSSARHVG